MRSLLLASVALVFFFNSAYASGRSRNCTAEEKAAADTHLKAIAADPALQAPILKRHLPFGAHTTDGNADNEILLLQDGYVINHDSDLRTGLWVAYELVGTEVDNPGPQRVNCFRKDPRLDRSKTAALSDFDEPIYDRGHLANDRDLKDDLQEQINSYVLSNMSAQHCRFNRGIWLSLEYLGRIYSRKYKSIHVTSGAIFDYNNKGGRDKDNKSPRMGSRNQKARVAVPSHYYKIFLRETVGRWHSISFLLENNNGINGHKWSDARPVAERAIKSIEQIEKRAGVKIHPDLTRTIITQDTDGSLWGMDEGRASLENRCPS